MGRPLKESVLVELPIKAFINGASTDATLTQQKGTGVYEVVAEISGTTHTSRVKLVDKEEPTTDGEASIVVYPFGGNPETVRQVNGRQVKTFKGNTYVWVLGFAESVGEAGFYELPVITTHPASQTVADGQSVTFSVEATGEDLSYQWNYLTLAGPAPISGAHSATYTFTASTADDGKKFNVTVSNDGGFVYSDAATLTVTPA